MTNKEIHEARIEGYVERKIKKIVKVIFIVIFGAIAIVALALLFGYVVMLLWNWLLPAIFGLGVISFWQAVGIVILAKLLFGGFGGGGSRSGRRKKNLEKRLKHRLRERCSETGIKEWRMYDQYWEEEGKEAYQAFIERKVSGEEGSDK
ncbi:MAG: hypothetical protein ABF295_04300 [Flavobacteriaceae bacterium]